mgnify:CR=1 FL=1
MKRNHLTICLLGILWSFSAHAYELGGLAIQGEAAFDYNYLSTGDNRYPSNGGALNDQYRFNMAQILVKKEADEISFLTRLSYIPTEVTTPGGGSTKSSFGTLDQFEIYYKFRPDLKVGFGRLCSTMGFESAMRYENVFYNNTVAYGSIVPGYGEGLRAMYNPGEWLALTLSTYNRSTYNQYGDDYNSTKTTEFSATGVLGPVLWFAGYYWGTDNGATATDPKLDKSTSNAWATYKFNDAFSFSVSYDSRTQKPQDASTNYAQSISGQASYILGKHTLGLRYENILGAGELDVLNGTTSLGYIGADKVQVFSAVEKYSLSENLNMYLEYRQDVADQSVLKDRNGDDTKNAYMITLGAIAKF